MAQAFKCDDCQEEVYSAHVHYDKKLERCVTLCKRCKSGSGSSCRLFEYGHENPMDPKGSTAHVRDIKSRRLDPQTGQVVRWNGPKSFFFPKGMDVPTKRR